MEFNQIMPDGGTFFGVGMEEYLKAIQNAPPGTLIKVGELSPGSWVKCLKCGDEMEEALKDFHSC